MRTSSQLLLTFLLNAVWQIALIAALASVGAWLLRQSATRFQHWLWVAALCLSLLVPVMTALRTVPISSPSVQPEIFNPVLPEGIDPVLPQGAVPNQSPSTSVSSWSFQLNASLVLALVSVYGLFLLYGSFRLLQAWRTTRKIRNAAVDLEGDEAVGAIMRECAKRLNFRSDRVRVCR